MPAEVTARRVQMKTVDRFTTGQAPPGRLRLAVLLVAALASRASGQYLTRPDLPWETVRTAHFTFHFPAEMRAWTTEVAGRMESIATDVNALVGHVPDSRVTVMVEDPSGIGNGFALPFLEGPVMFLWPTPPTPSPAFGAYGDWGEALAVHEYGHIAHLTIPSRNPNERRLWRFLPERIGPVARKAPAWVIEGFATLIEGKLTGNGRPGSVGRAAVLRQWALEGKLPTYGQLNGAGPFLGGNMRYLVGSAFLEWLETRKGDSSLVHVWRRMSARTQRSFSGAFSGVFGAPPDDMYGQFFVDVMSKALDAQRVLRAAGLTEGELVQKLNWNTGEPAVSPDGKLLAIVLRSPGAPSRLVVWRTEDPQADSAAVRRRARLLRLDSLDVPPFDSFPAPRRAVATLQPYAGRGHDLPRWMPDGVHVLVSRDEPAHDGATRPDLFIWNYRTGDLHRVTQHASIRYADPSPDGRSAVAMRCEDGVCGLVTVDLASGEWRTLVSGSVSQAWYRPRWSPDGRRIAASVHANGAWHLAVIQVSSGEVRMLDTDDGTSQYSPSWRSADAIVYVSERGGIANLATMNVSTGATASLTRVTGAVLAPDVGRADSVAYFLALHAKGYDLRRLDLRHAPALDVVASGPELAPAVATGGRAQAPVYPEQPIAPPRSYRLGPRQWRVLPGAEFSTDGALGTLMLANIDPIARLSVVAQGGYGDRGTWRGGALDAALRRLPVELEATAWYSDRRPDQDDEIQHLIPFNSAYSGGGMAARWQSVQSTMTLGVRGGASIGVLHGNGYRSEHRAFAFLDARARSSWSRGARLLTAGVTLHGAAGTTAGEAWLRALGSVGVVAGTSRAAVRGQATLGVVTAPSGSAGGPGLGFEQFVVGGAETPYIDRAWLMQHQPVAGLPSGFISGRRIGTVKATVAGIGVAEPFVTWLAAGDRLRHWKRVAGLEREFSSPALGFARLPAVQIHAGVSYSLDEPYRRKWRAWGGITYRP